jgi:hypothetical protein
MTASRTISRLLSCYPSGWRARYGDELEALILDMTDGRRVPWRVRADVVGGAGRERLRASGLTGDGPAPTRVRAGAVLVMWAWALFILGGAIVGKSSEHWQSAMPTGAGHSAATVAFDVVTGGAVLTGVLVLAGIGLALPSMLGWLRDGGWRQIRGPIATAAWLSAAALAATIGLVAWAHGLSAHARNGHDGAYGIAFLAWAALCAATLLAWTSAAARTARHLTLPPRTLRWQARLASAAAVGMAVIVAATLVWWVVVADAAPGALTGGPDGRHASAIVARLVVAIVFMLSATTLGAIGARRAAGAIGALASE